MRRCCPLLHSKQKRQNSSNLPQSTICVNEVLESEKLKVIQFKTILRSEDTNEKLHHHIESSQPSENVYKKDWLGRKSWNFSIDGNLFEGYVARHSLTVPRYLIVFQNRKKEEQKN